MKLVIVGGSDAGISAGLRARELDSAAEVTVVVADRFPNYSICGIPYHVSGEVPHWTDLAHRTEADLAATGMTLRLETRATAIDVDARRLSVVSVDGLAEELKYDELIVGTGAVPRRPRIEGLAGDTPLDSSDGVHLLHSMGDTFALMETLTRVQPKRALIVGGGYIGLEMAEGLTIRGIHVVQLEKHDQVLATLDPELGALVGDELVAHGVEVHTHTVATSIEKVGGGLRVIGEAAGIQSSWEVDVVLVVVGVVPDAALLAGAGAELGVRGAVNVDERMATSLPHVWAAGDCAVTHHRLIGTTYLPLGTTAHKQGRVAGENALGGNTRFAGSLGTQVVKVFDQVAARTGLRHDEAVGAGFQSVTFTGAWDDHKAYYPGAQPITISVTGDADTGMLLGAQLLGRYGTETAKRVDTFATALYHQMTVEQISELDLSYTPPLGSPWDAVQQAAQHWVRSLATERITE